MVDEKGVDLFMELFEGLDRAYGTYVVSGGQRQDGKATGRAKTVHEPVTRTLWEDHLAGKTGLGIVPIRDDNTVKWAALDIDDYEVEVPAVLNKAAELLPSVLGFRTKSGGLHIYVFFTEGVEARIAQARMRELAASIGYGTCEVYPKQTEILTERGDVGSWLNLPYFGAENTTRYLYHPSTFTPLALDEALELAYARRLTLGEFVGETIKPKARGSDVFPDGPPCLNHLATTGFPPGTRNDGLMNLGVYARKAFPSNWEEMVETYNKEYMSPPLDSSEVQGVIKSLKRKDYEYSCSRPPIKPHCNSPVCRLRAHGVGGDAGLPNLGSLTKLCTEPPLWFLDVDDKRLELTTEDLQQQPRFQRRCMDTLNMMPPEMSKANWRQVVQTLLDSVNEIEVPADASARGQFAELVERFCTGRAQARTKDEILLSKPWFSEEEQTYWFRLSDLLSFLDRNNFKDLSRNRVTARLRDMGAVHGFKKIRHRGMNLWGLPKQ